MTDRQISDRETVPLPPKRKRNRVHRRERRAIERAERGEMFYHDAWWAIQSSGAPSSTLVPDRLTESSLLHSDPISAMRPAVYPPVTLEGRPTANDNSPFQFDQELGESASLYKPTAPDPQLHLISYPEERRFSQKLFSAVELLCILLCANFGIQAFIFHHTSEPWFLYVEKSQL